jgi:hypothetical protein
VHSWNKLLVPEKSFTHRPNSNDGKTQKRPDPKIRPGTGSSYFNELGSGYLMYYLKLAKKFTPDKLSSNVNDWLAGLKLCRFALAETMYMLDAVKLVNV